ncbi:hypothetical protein AB205_0188030, partial [Aquarana catesbeiana]
MKLHTAQAPPSLSLAILAPARTGSGSVPMNSVWGAVPFMEMAITYPLITNISPLVEPVNTHWFRITVVRKEAKAPLELSCRMSSVAIMALYGEELYFDEEKIEIVKRGEANSIQYELIRKGMYLILKSVNGLFIIWDTKATVHVKLSSDFK